MKDPAGDWPGRQPFGDPDVPPAYLGYRLRSYGRLVLRPYRLWMLAAALTEAPAFLAIAAAALLCVEHDAPAWLPVFALPWVPAVPRLVFAVAAALVERAPHTMATVVRGRPDPRMRAELWLRYVCPKGAGHAHVGYSVAGVWLQPLAFLAYLLLPGPWAGEPGERVDLHAAMDGNTLAALAWTILCVHRDWAVQARAIVLPREASRLRGQLYGLT